MITIQTFRIFSIVCYNNSDNLNYIDIIDKINLNDFKFISIMHQPESDELKLHYHVVLYFPVPTTLKNISNKLCIPENYIKVRDENGNRYTLKNTVGYLLHYNNKDKINYSYNDIVTNCEDLVKKYYDILTGGSDERNELKEIMAFINDNHATISDILSFCIECNYLKTFKKYSYVLTTLCRYNY